MVAWLSQFTKPCYKHGEIYSHLVTLFINFSCPDVAVSLCVLHAIMYELYHVFLMRPPEAPKGKMHP